MYYSRLKTLTRTLKSHHRQSPLPFLSSTTIRSPPQPFSTTSIEPPQSPPQHFQTLEALRHRLAARSPTLNDVIRPQSTEEYSVEVGTKKNPFPKPEWMKESILSHYNGRFCNVKTSHTPPPPDPKEPSNVAEAIASRSLEELQSTVQDHHASFKQSMDVLMMAKDHGPAGTLNKTSKMLGCGETPPDQVVKTMEKVKPAGVDVMTSGQSMRPSKLVSSSHIPLYSGIKDIMADYVHHEMTRTLFLVYFRLFLLILTKDVFLFLFFT